MSDFDREYLLQDAIHEFRAEALPYLHPAGTGAVRATVRRRRQVRSATLAALVAVLVLAPVAAFAAIGNDRTRPRPGASSTASVAPSPSASASAKPSSAKPSSTPPGPSAPTDLSNATIVLGTWGPHEACPTGPITFAHGSRQSTDKPLLSVEKTAAVDLDHDGGTETVAIVFCQDSQAGTYQAVAVKAAPDGSLTTLGQVAHSDQNMEDINGVAAGPNGTVALTVGDILVCCGGQPSEELKQVRTFAWNGSAFNQVDGPTTFIADASVADLTGSAPVVNFSAKVNGVRTATLTLTVRNKGPQAAKQVSVLLGVGYYFANGSGSDWAKCPTPAGSSGTRLCQLGTVAAGATMTLTLPLTPEADQSYQQPASAWNIGIGLRTGDLKYPEVTFPVTFSGP